MTFLWKHNWDQLKEDVSFFYRDRQYTVFTKENDLINVYSSLDDDTKVKRIYKLTQDDFNEGRSPTYIGNTKRLKGGGKRTKRRRKNKRRSVKRNKK